MKKTMLNLFGLLALCVSFQAAAHEDDNPYKFTPRFAECMDKSGETTLGMKECIAEETNKQDKRLNSAYKKVLKSLSSKRQAQLKKAQRAWVAYRDAECEYLHDPDGGTLAGVISANCYMDKTAQRATELESSMEEGNVR